MGNAPSLRNQPKGKTSRKGDLAEAVDGGHNRGDLAQASAPDNEGDGARLGGLPRMAASILMQPRTGTIGLRAYLRASNRADSSRCACGQVQTVRHILQECPHFNELRTQIRPEGLTTRVPK
jgi:hypothetical protein